jgi:hypothetical protein
MSITALLMIMPDKFHVPSVTVNSKGVLMINSRASAKNFHRPSVNVRKNQMHLLVDSGRQ